MKLLAVDFLILFLYLGFVVGIGYWLKSRMHSAEDFLLAGRSLPAWITGLAFMAANLGSLEIVGMMAMSAKYGAMTCHWYWLGAIPPMIFLGIFMMRFYYSGRIRSVPEYLRLRFDSRCHLLNSVSFVVVTILMSGINMYALGLVCEEILGWNFHLVILSSAAIVVLYTFFGGLTSSIYNEVLQFFLIVFGFAPLPFLGLLELGGWQGLRERVPGVFLHVWQGMGSAETNPLGVNWITAVVALMFVMGPSYWCTDFLLVQRALSARNLISAQKTPLIAALPKMLFPGLVVIPGLVAAAVVPQALEGNYNVALTALMARYFPPGMLGLGFTALVASFMSGMAGNVTAFNTVWTYDLCETYLFKNRDDQFYLRMGRGATILGTVLSVAAAYIVLLFDNLMDYMQLIGTLFISPFFVVFLLGMLWRRVTPTGAFVGVILGVSGGLSHHLLYYSGVISYATPMAATLQLAVWEGCAGAAATLVTSWLTKPKPAALLDGLVYTQSGVRENSVSRGVVVWAAVVFALFVVLNLVFA